MGEDLNQQVRGEDRVASSELLMSMNQPLKEETQPGTHPGHPHKREPQVQLACNPILLLPPSNLYQLKRGHLSTGLFAGDDRVLRF